MRRLAAALVATTIALGVVELTARAHEGDTVLVGDARRYVTRPGTWGSNALGLHERELPLAPDPSVRRIVVLGDSMTWGTTTAAEAWPRRAEEALGAPWQVLNLSHYGYDAAQSAAVLDEVGWALGPEVVVFAAYVNDLLPTRMITVGEPPLYVWLGPGGLLPEPVRRASAALRLVEGAAMARRYTPAEEPDEFTAAVRHMRDTSHARGVPFLVYGLAPHVLATADPTACDALARQPGWCAAALEQHAREAALVHDLGVPWGSVLPALQASGRPSFFPANPADADHPSPAGHVVIGEAFAEWVRPRLPEATSSGRSP